MKSILGIPVFLRGLNQRLIVLLCLLMFNLFGVSLYAQYGPNDDADGDGIVNSIDIDDDNDGILDVNEGYCYTQSVYTFQPANTLAGATFGANGGTINLVYTLTSGTPVPGLGNSFTVPFTYSDLNNTANSQDHTWESFITNATPEFRILPNTTSLYTGLPTNNKQIEIGNTSPDQGFRNLLSAGNIDKLGTFTTTIGNLPAITSALASYSSNTDLTMRSIFNVTYDVSVPTNWDNGFYARMQLQTNVNTGIGGSTLPYTVQYGQTYTFDYTAFNGSGTGATNGGTRGLISIAQNTVTYCNHRDTDGDGIPDYLDLDSDNDGCPDALEGDENVTMAQLATAASGLSVGTGSASSNVNLGTTVDANGVPTLVNSGGAADLGGDQGQGVGYSINTNANICIDTDGDGIPDLIDIDDDNDGVLDAVEAPACYYTATEANVISTITSGLTSTIDDQADGDIQVLHDANSSTYTFYFTASQAMAGANIFTVKYPTAINLTSLTLVSSTSMGTGATAILQGSNDNTTWTTLTGTAVALSTTANKVFTVNQNAGEYQYYRVLGVATATTLATGTIAEITSVINTSAYAQSSHPKPTCGVDTDGDGLTNDKDLDSDGDGCPDAYEAGATNDKVQSVFAGNVGANGLANSLETNDLATATTTYNSTYNKYATISAANLCNLTDTDGDGIPDVLDIDIDNDGVLNNIEAPACYYTATEANVITTVTSGLTSTVDNQSDGDIQVLHDANSSTYTFYFTASQAMAGANIFTVKYPTAINLTSLTLVSATNMGTGATAILQGSNNNSYWVTLTSAPVSLATTANKVFTIDQNADEYQYYRVLGVATATTLAAGTIAEITSVMNATNYVSALHAKATCTEDIDNDGITNDKDTDSDGDGCTDAYESGAVASNVATVAAPYGTNGLANSIESSDLATATTTYTSTYNKYAIYKALNICADTDSDGIPDLIDIDDDNDGVLDAVEAPGCYYTATEANAISTITSGLTSADDNQADGDIQLLHDAALTTYTFNFDASQQLQNANILTVQYPTSVNLTSLTIENNTSLGTGATANLQGSNDNVNWTTLTSTQ